MPERKVHFVETLEEARLEIKQKYGDSFLKERRKAVAMILDLTGSKFNISEIEKFLDDEQEHENIVINKNADVNSNLLDAIINNSYENVIKWLNVGAEPNARVPDIDGIEHRNHTALMLACIYAGDLRIVKELIKRRADVNAKKNSGWTALMSATKHTNNIELIQMLIENKADVTAITKEGDTVLDLIEKKQKCFASK